MNVLMFGWEFPPHISGGLGTACAGLTCALEKGNVSVLFAIPKLHGGEKVGTTRFINASSIPIRQQKITQKAITGPRTTSVSTEDHPGKYSAIKKGLDIIEVPSDLSPYSTSTSLEGHPFDLKRWNYSFGKMDERTIPANLRRLPGTGAGDQGDATEAGQDEMKPHEFSGSYGPGMLQEVERYASAGAEIARQYSFDVIHAHDWMTYPAAIAAKRVSGKPLIVHVHSTEIDRSGTGGNRAVFDIEKKGMEEADKVVTVSYWTKKIAVRHYHIDNGKIEVVHNGITKRATTAVKSFLPPVGPQIVTFLGRITHQKGPMFFVEAARRVHEQFPDVHFVVAGSGDQLPQMIERIAQIRLSSHFHFTGFLDSEDIDRIWSISSVYVMPSVSEPFGIAPLEAIQAGVPVILSNQAGVAEVMPDAIKVDFWNSEALSEAICNVLRFKSLANTLRKNGAERLKSITWDKAAEKITSLYYELTSNHHQSPKPDIIFSGTSAAKTAHTSLLRYRP